MTNLQLTLVALSLLCMAIAVCMLVRPRRLAAALPALLAMLVLQATPCLVITLGKCLMWTATAVLVAIVWRMQPAGEPDGHGTGALYVGLGALAGAVVGIALGSAWILAATIVGAVLGVMAYSRTPRGRWLKLGKSTIIHYFCARALPAIVAAAITGVCAEGLLFYFKTIYHYT